MDTRQKILVDRLVAKPLAWALTLSARAVEPLLRRDHSADPNAVRTIVVAKLLGMGSILQATPFLHALKQGFPNARLIFLTTEANRPLIERLPVIDEAIYLRDKGARALASDCLVAVAKLMTEGIDLYFDLEVYSAGASILAFTSLARNRYGFYRHSARFKKGNYTHLVYLNVRMPIARLYLQLYEAARGSHASASAVHDLSYGPLHVEDAEVEAVHAKLLSTKGAGRSPYMVVNPNASDLLLERRWPAARFKEVIEKLVARGHQIVLVGAPSEAPYVHAIWESIDAKARANVVDSAGKLSLPELFALIKGARCVITNDTGPMHVSIALERPTVCLFGPGSPDHYGVHRPDVEILYESVVCSPCIYETDEPPCAGHNVCMQLITTTSVLDAVARLIGEMPAKRRETRHLPLALSQTRYFDERGRALGVVAHASIMDDDSEDGD